MTLTINRAFPDDLDDVLSVLNDAASRLSADGLDQWSGGFGPDRIGPYVANAEMYLVRAEDGRPLATIRWSSEADPDFWTAEESGESALYFSKLARATDAPNGLGTTLLRWMTDHAAKVGWRWVRLDAWRSNPALHRYYLDRGWDFVRLVDAPGRRSGALFQRRAIEDLAARSAFVIRPDVSVAGMLPAGTRVVVTGGTYEGSTGTVTGIYDPDQANEFWDLQADKRAWSYWVQLDGALVTTIYPQQVRGLTLA